jgi:hypothetical protein
MKTIIGGRFAREDDQSILRQYIQSFSQTHINHVMAVQLNFPFLGTYNFYITREKPRHWQNIATDG